MSEGRYAAWDSAVLEGIFEAEDLAEDKNHWFAQGAAAYHQADAVRVVPGVVFHFKHCVEIARAWYRGWDQAATVAASDFLT